MCSAASLSRSACLACSRRGKRKGNQSEAGDRQPTCWVLFLSPYSLRTSSVMTSNQIALAYLVASVLFIFALKGLSSPATARRGNLFGIAGMALAVLTTLSMVHNHALILGAIAIGGVIGAVVARRVQLTAMPELVAFMHSLVGLAAVFIAITAVNYPAAFGLHDPLPMGNKLELFIGTFIGAMTWSGSVIAFLKLSGRMSGRPI